MDLTPALIDSPIDLMARCYVIAATARTGSNYLCSLLANNGVGRPREHFNAWLLRNAFARAIATGQSTESFAADARRDAPKPFGTKILSSFAEPMLLNSEGKHLDLSTLMNKLLPGAKYVFLSRRDKVDQAISRVRAEVTNEWYRRSDAEMSVRPKRRLKQITPDAIHGMLLTTRREELEWRRFFAASKIHPLKVIYEDLCADPKGELARVGRFILGRNFKVRTLDTPLLIQRDHQSEKLRAAYFAAVGA
jgi:trehalose 2-sulfotransferase